MKPSLALACLALLLAACGQGAPAPDPGYGANPQLPAPQQNGPIPAINTAKAVGWPQGAMPHAPQGFVVTRYAGALDHPRSMLVLPNGDVLVAQSSSEAQTSGGVVGWVRNQVQRYGGALGVSANKVTLLRDGDGDGVVDETHIFAEHLNQPFGMALVGDHIFIANTDGVVRFAYTPGADRLAGPGETVLRLPHHPGDNGHWTRDLAVAPDGSKLFVGVGSSSNIADYGMGAEEGRAAVWSFNPDGSAARVYAQGLRNPAGVEIEPATGALWVVVNERDMLGDNLVPDYMTRVQDGAFYGWPYSYYGRHVDNRVSPQRPDLVARALAPDYALGAHTASLGLQFYAGALFGEHYRGGAFIAQHGSWNRSVLAGYKVVFVPFANARPAGRPEDFLTGFLNARGQAQGRPVGLAIDRTGALLVADDAGDTIWRVAPAQR